ncbi:hypothetical protein K2X33_15830, partial [bacterium]|nr:hypothetical protein [bacterium]
VRFEKGKVTRLVNADYYRFSTLLWDAQKQRLFVADRNPKDPGIRVYDREGKEMLEHFIRLDLPPFSMLLKGSGAAALPGASE